jgi:hypothetical protein
MMGESEEDLGCWGQAEGLSPAGHHAAHHVEFVPSSVVQQFQLLFVSRLPQGEKQAQRPKGIEIEEPRPIKSREDRQNPGRRLIRSWDERRRKVRKRREGRKIVNPKYIEVIEEGRYLWATENGRHKLCGI